MSWIATMRHATTLSLVMLCCGLAAVEPRPGSVQWSDGTEQVGTIVPATGAEFKFHDGKTLHLLTFAQLRDLRLLPEKEEMLRHFRMPEPGKAFKEEFGEPYPLREFQAQVVLISGETMTGHLYATSLVIETKAPSADPTGDPGERRKVFVPAKQQGKNGETLLGLRYPARIAFNDVGAADALTRLTATLSNGPADELAVIARDSLAVLTVQAEAKTPGTFAIAAPLESRFFLAVRRGQVLIAGWPANDAALMARMTAALADTKDFFDDKRLLGAWRPEGSNSIYTLLLLYRQGVITNDDQKPWHLEVLRWKTNDEQRLMLAARGTLLRGIATNAAELPTVRLSAGLWNAVAANGAMELTP